MRQAARSAGIFAASYDLLARAYLGGPRALTAGRLPPLGPLLGALAEIDMRWPGTVRSLVDRFATDPDRAERAFLECVAIPVPGRCVPPYASVYLDGGTLWGPSTFEVLHWYEAEGLAWDRDRLGAAGTRIVAPDHLGVEMAFLSVLSDRHTANRGSRGERGAPLRRAGPPGRVASALSRRARGRRGGFVPLHPRGVGRARCEHRRH